MVETGIDRHGDGSVIVIDGFHCNCKQFNRCESYADQK